MTNRIIPHNTLTCLCNRLGEAVIALDQERRISLFNTAAETAFGLRAADILGTRLDEHPALDTLTALADWVVASDEIAQQEFTVASGQTWWVRMFVVTESRSGTGRLKLAARKETTSQAADPMREIVHDLKVRIASAKGFIDLIEAAGELNGPQQKFARRAHLSLISMLSQVHEILDMSWLDAGGKLEKTPTDLNELVEHAVTHLEGYAHQVGIDFSLDLSADGCSISGDERRLGSAISNLISNAIKYSPDGGSVHISVEEQKQTVTLRVQDQGLGIPEESLPLIFQRFYRVRTPETRRIEGSGLGLAIVKAIVEKHGGTVFVESELGVGSMFGFTLPLS